MKRREFVHQSALAGSTMMFSPWSLPTMKAAHVGLQLYSVRDVIVNDPAGTLTALGQMGYREAEGYIYENRRFHSFTPKEVASFYTQYGLRMTGMHTAIDFKHADEKRKKLSDAAKELIEDHAEAGIQLLINPWLPESYRTPETLHQLCDVYNLVGEGCRAAGMQFGYHNHEFEFVPVGNRFLMDIMLERTDPELMALEMDIFWVAAAGQDPVEWLNKYPGRVRAFHVKDMDKEPPHESVVIGQGSIDFEAVFATPGANEVKYYYIEQEHYKTTSLESVQQCLIAFRKLKRH